MTIYLRKAGQQNEQSNGFHTRKMKKNTEFTYGSEDGLVLVGKLNEP